MCDVKVKPIHGSGLALAKLTKESKCKYFQIELSGFLKSVAVVKQSAKRTIFEFCMVHDLEDLND